MEHENTDQVEAFVSELGGPIWISLCSCGAAFWNTDGILAHEEWEEHESDNGY